MVKMKLLSTMCTATEKGKIEKQKNLIQTLCVGNPLVSILSLESNTSAEIYSGFSPY